MESRSSIARLRAVLARPGRAAVAGLVTVLVFAVYWLLRFNDPEGSYAGMSDDHLFYAIRGWQILYGELPSRDFVDHGAPLTFWLAAAVQWAFGESTNSEILFTLSALALGVAMTFRMALRASGSIVIALFAVGFQAAVGLRLYNYPKIIVYALAIPALWAFIDRPHWRRGAVVAAVTAMGFLLRHDHGVFVGLGMLAAIVMLDGVPVRERVRHALAYGAAVVALLLPYFVYLQAYGGLVQHFRTAMAWAARDRDRSPLEWPSLDLGAVGWSPGGLVDAIQANSEAWLFYSLVAWPLIALAVLAARRGAGGAAWPHARAKLTAVAVVALAVDAGFLRSPLAARFGDVSVPAAVLFAWMLAAAGRVTLGRGPGPSRPPWVRTLAAAAVLVLALVPGVTALRLGTMAERASFLEGVRSVRGHLVNTFRVQAASADLDAWARTDLPGAIRLIFYVRACTAPTDHVFVSQYMPQVAGMARRPFAGGQGDLRSSFFETDYDQRLFIARMERQSVPIAIVPPARDYRDFTRSLPLVGAYFAERFRWIGDRELGDGQVVGILVDRALRPARTYELLDAPCFN